MAIQSSDKRIQTWLDEKGQVSLWERCGFELRVERPFQDDLIWPFAPGRSRDEVELYISRVNMRFDGSSPETLYCRHFANWPVGVTSSENADEEVWLFEQNSEQIFCLIDKVNRVKSWVERDKTRSDIEDFLTYLPVNPEKSALYLKNHRVNVVKDERGALSDLIFCSTIVTSDVRARWIGEHYEVQLINSHDEIHWRIVDPEGKTQDAKILSVKISATFIDKYASNSIIRFYEGGFERFSLMPYSPWLGPKRVGPYLDVTLKALGDRPVWHFFDHYTKEVSLLEADLADPILAEMLANAPNDPDENRLYFHNFQIELEKNGWGNIDKITLIKSCAFSELDPTLCVNPSYGVVAMICSAKSTQGDLCKTGHAMMAIETFENGGLAQRRLHITGAPENRRFRQERGNFVEIELRPGLGHIANQTPAWVISAEKINQLFKEIEEEARYPIPFNMSGNQTLGAIAHRTNTIFYETIAFVTGLLIGLASPRGRLGMREVGFVLARAGVQPMIDPMFEPRLHGWEEEALEARRLHPVDLNCLLYTISKFRRLSLLFPEPTGIVTRPYDYIEGIRQNPTLVKQLED